MMAVIKHVKSVAVSKSFQLSLVRITLVYTSPLSSSLVSWYMWIQYRDLCLYSLNSIEQRECSNKSLLSCMKHKVSWIIEDTLTYRIHHLLPNTDPKE